MKRNFAKSKASLVFAIILGVIMVGYLIVTSVMDLTNKKDLVNVEVSECYELLTIEHSINGLIPVGKDHYYVALDKNGSDLYIIKASKSFIRNFDENGVAKSGSTVSVKALSKRVGDYQVRQAIQDRSALFEGYNVVPGGDGVLYADYFFTAVCKLLVLIILALIILFGVIATKKHIELKGPLGFVLIVLIVAWLLLFLKVLR